MTEDVYWLLLFPAFGVVLFILIDKITKPRKRRGEGPRDMAKDREPNRAVSRVAIVEQPAVESPHEPSAETLNTVLEIALIKDELPFHLAAQTSALGLYVQSSSTPKDTLRIMAGAKTKPYLDVFARLDGTFDVKLYRPGEWEALVNPTLELARQLSGSDRLGLD